MRDPAYDLTINLSNRIGSLGDWDPFFLTPTAKVGDLKSTSQRDRDERAEYIHQNRYNIGKTITDPYEIERRARMNKQKKANKAKKLASKQRTLNARKRKK